MPNCSAMTNGEWLGQTSRRQTPMQRGGIRRQIANQYLDVAALAMPVILWCSASQSDDSRAFQPDGRDRESGRMLLALKNLREWGPDRVAKRNGFISKRNSSMDFVTD